MWHLAISALPMLKQDRLFQKVIVVESVLVHLGLDLCPLVRGQVQSPEIAEDLPSISLVARIPSSDQPQMPVDHHCLRC